MELHEFENTVFIHAVGIVPQGADLAGKHVLMGKFRSIFAGFFKTMVRHRLLDAIIAYSIRCDYRKNRFLSFFYGCICPSVGRPDSCPPHEKPSAGAAVVMGISPPSFPQTMASMARQASLPAFSSGVNSHAAPRGSVHRHRRSCRSIRRCRFPDRAGCGHCVPADVPEACIFGVGVFKLL